jgi:hypothetical protein
MIHKHHIIPRHIGGTDDPSNLIEVTVEEHAEIHRKLFEEHGRWQDEIAWKAITGIIPCQEVIQEAHRAGGRMTKNHWPEERKVKARKMMKGNQINKGRVMSEENKKKISAALVGHVQPQSQKDKVAAALSKQWKITDPSGKSFVVTNLTSYCRDTGLDQGNMMKVVSGVQTHHKSYKCERT